METSLSNEANPLNLQSDDLDIAMVTGPVNGRDSSSDDDLIHDQLFPYDFESDCWISESRQESIDLRSTMNSNTRI